MKKPQEELTEYQREVLRRAVYERHAMLRYRFDKLSNATNEDVIRMRADLQREAEHLRSACAVVGLVPYWSTATKF